jgi:predicted Kef-type K+ transport protein
MEAIDLMGIETSAERKLKLMPLTFKTRFAVANLLVYTIIISMKLGIAHLSASLYTVSIAFAALYLASLYQESRLHQQAVRRIRALNAETPIDRQFDQKVRAYHELRERR